MLYDTAFLSFDLISLSTDCVIALYKYVLRYINMFWIIIELQKQLNSLDDHALRMLPFIFMRDNALCQSPGSSKAYWPALTTIRVNVIVFQ